MVGIEELGSVGFSLRGVIAPSRGRSSCARLGSSFSVLGPHFASFNGCFQVLVVLFSSFDAFWWRLNDLLVFWPSASFSRPPSLTSLFCPRPILSLSSPPSFLTNPLTKLLSSHAARSFVCLPQVLVHRVHLHSRVTSSLHLFLLVLNPKLTRGLFIFIYLFYQDRN